MVGRPDVTVVLPTVGRRGSLARALRGLGAQEAAGLAWELVVVDNGPPGRPGTSVEALVAEAGLGVPARVVREPVAGASRARNRGLAEARGQVVAFLDDDVVPACDWLARLVAPVLAGLADGAGGRVVLDPSVPRPRWFNPDWMAGYLTELDLGPAARDLTAGEWVLSANAAFDGALLAEAGGFSPELGPKAGDLLFDDDVELCRRLLERGARLRFVPEALVVHELPEERLCRRYLVRRLFAQGRSDWRMERGRGRSAVALARERLARDLRLRLREGLLRPPVLHRAVGEAVVVGGVLAEAAADAARAALGAAVRRAGRRAIPSLTAPRAAGRRSAPRSHPS